MCAGLTWGIVIVFYYERQRLKPRSASVDDAERRGARCAVNVGICLVHRSLEEILAQLDPGKKATACRLLGSVGHA